MTYESLVNALDKVAPTLYEEGYRSDIDVQANAIRIQGSSEGNWADIVGHADIHVPVEFKAGQLYATPAVSAWAGLQLIGDDGNCTEGFSMKEGSNRRISTAAHCPNTMTRGGVNIPFNDAQFGGSHDEQIHTGGGTTITNRAQDSSTDMQTFGYRNITGKTLRANQPLNAFYCRYGLGGSPSYACGTLISKTAQGGMPNPSSTLMVLDWSTTDLSSPGDSGGPSTSVAPPSG